jgi:hypothetical protein
MVLWKTGIKFSSPIHPAGLYEKCDVVFLRVDYIEQKEEYLKTGDAKIIIYALNVRHSDAIHLEEMQVMTEETRQQNDGKLFKKLPLLCEQIGIGTLTVSEYLHRNGFFIDK